jgi:hypothetical protein
MILPNDKLYSVPRHNKAIQSDSATCHFCAKNEQKAAVCYAVDGGVKIEKVLDARKVI